jgi:hypothetical protein
MALLGVILLFSGCIRYWTRIKQWKNLPDPSGGNMARTMASRISSFLTKFCNTI